MFCKVCSKHFTNENSFANHKQSKKHKDLESAYVSAIERRTNSESASPKSNQIIDKLLNIKSDRTEKKVRIFIYHISHTSQLKITFSLLFVEKKVIQMNEYLKKCEKLAAEAEAEELKEDDMDETDLANWEDVGEDDEVMDQFGKYLEFSY